MHFPTLSRGPDPLGLASASPLPSPRRRVLNRLTLAASLWLAAAGAAWADRAPLHLPNHPASAKTTLTAPPAKRVQAPVIEQGRQCTTIDFEGVGNLAAIPDFDGISSPGWLGIIDADAGGSGNFAQEPTPETIAFWLGGDPGSRDIVMSNKASKLEFYYASSVTVTMQALDEAGVVLATSVGAPNFNLGTGDPTGQYNRWDPLKVEVQGNTIKTVRVTGNTNNTGIDNLKVCTTIGIAAAEMTQAIQQYQDLPDLKTSLQASREPLVPIVADKPGVLRLYMEKVNSVTPVTVALSGAVSQTKTVTLQPQCTPEKQRRRENGCVSVDFYFKPPQDNWDLTVKVLDSNNAVLESHELPFKSRKTRTLALKAVSVCDAKDAAGAWLCAPANALTSKLGVLRKIAPTSSVTVQVTSDVVRRDVATFATVNQWWPAAIKDVNDFYGIADSVGDLVGGKRTTYYGMIRPALPGGTGGMAHAIPGRGAGSRTSALRLGVETVNEVVAHEVGHTLGLRHTNTGAPAAAGSPPGCYNFAADGATDWPFANNQIQSAARLEVGFDVAAQKPLLPETSFDIMSYCVPRWISPLRYKSALTILGGGAVTTPSQAARPLGWSPPKIRGAAVSQTQFWNISGTLSDDVASFDPVFDDHTQGSTELGEGSHRIELQTAGGTVLFTRLFTPAELHSESERPGEDIEGPASFYERVPVIPETARVVVFDEAQRELGRLNFGGTRPLVTLTSAVPDPLSGQYGLSWAISDPDGAQHRSRVLYSIDNGANWSTVGQLDGETGLLLDFDRLPGTEAGLLRIAVSDGVNTGQVTSAPFSVPKKAIAEATIVTPEARRAYALDSMVEFEASVYDVDDGVLDGEALRWSSDRDGELGHGALLAINTLRSGTHLITLHAQDSDGNTASATTEVRIAGAAPTLSLTVTPLDTLPTTCVEATVAPKAEPGGVGLALTEYSVDGGESWQAIAPNRLPFKFIVPGSGFIHLLARTTDEAGQLVARDAKFFINSPCEQGGVPRLDGHITAKGTAAPGVVFVEVALTNSGAGLAQQIRIDSLALRTLSGSGTVTFNTAQSPSLPIALTDLGMTESTSVRLYFNVPASVKRFSVTENISLQDKFGRPLKFANSQAVTP